MEFSEADIKDAREMSTLYLELVENVRQSMKYYLSNDVILDWFGQTVRGEKKVFSFLRGKLPTVKHHFSQGIPVSKIGFRDTHKIKLQKDSKKTCEFLSPERTSWTYKTPTKQTGPSTSSTPVRERDRSDSFSDSLSSPAKKLKLSSDDSAELDSNTIESEDDSLILKYMLAEGDVEFFKPSIKKLQLETKWRRPCKLSIAYTKTNKDTTIHLIIYEGNVRCKRNLLKEFSSEESEN